MDITSVMDYDGVLHMVNNIHIVEILKVPVYDKHNDRIIRTDKIYILTNGDTIKENASGG